MLLALLRIRNNSYWLVKVELCELLSVLDFKLVAFLEKQCADLRRGQHHYVGGTYRNTSFTQWNILHYLLLLLHHVVCVCEHPN